MKMMEHWAWNITGDSIKSQHDSGDNKMGELFIFPL